MSATSACRHNSSLKMFSPCLTIFLACLAFLVIASSSATVHKRVRIIGGTEITIDKVPYLVQLKDKHTGKFVCGGTLVKPTHVVTAAHCVKDRNPVEDWEVVGGASRLDEAGVRRNVIKTSVHPFYNEVVYFTHDIAVLKLDAPMEGENIQTVNLCSRTVEDGGLIQVSGWGATKDSWESNQVRTMRVPTVSYAECEQRYAYTRITGTMMCASNPGVEDACYGDSGGPGIYGGELCAVVSWGKGCARAEYPGIYTNVNTVQGFLYRALES